MNGRHCSTKNFFICYDCFFFKSARRVCNHMNFNSIKTALKTLNFLKKNDFCIFEPKNCEVITKTSSKAPHIWAKNHFNIISA